MRKIFLFCIILTTILTGCKSNETNEHEKLSAELSLAREQAAMYKLEIEQLQHENKQLKLQMEMQALVNSLNNQDSDGVQQLDLEDKHSQHKMRILSSFTSHYDKLTDTTFYQDKSSPKSNQSNALFAYISVKDNEEIGLRLKIQYCGSNWIYVQKYSIYTDENHYLIEPELFDFIRYQNLSGMLEYYDVKVKGEHINMLYDIMNSNQTIVKHIGATSEYEHVVSSSEKFALQNILLAYETLIKM